MAEDLIVRARELIESALEANEEERKRLERFVGQMGNSTRRRRSPARRRQIKRMKVLPGVRSKQVLKELKNGPGRAAELARRTGMASTGIYPVLGRLLKDGEVFKDGAEYDLVENQRKANAASRKSKGGKPPRPGKPRLRRPKR